VQSMAEVCDRSQCECANADERSVGNWPCVFCRDADGPPHSASKLWGQINRMASTLNGNWFSTRASGECKGDARPGDGGCFWREVQLLRNANATCVRTNFLGAIQQRNQPCYQACPQPNNVSSTCYVQCMLATIDGTGSASAHGPMSRVELVAPYLQSFQPVAKGGCPDVPVG
jgi:hypothetical protein